MRYWFYSEGNILGPYEPAEMLALPAFAEESLVCPETATGDNPGDWRPAAQVAEIATAMSVGTGRTVTAGVMSGAYEFETGFNASARYFEEVKDPGQNPSYGDLLDTIDNILGAYKEGKENPAKPAETDYDLAEKFDIRLSRIQEELEAARWEKNLLLEKIRMKELEEKRDRERIQELEAKLKSELGRTETGAKELEQVRHLADLKEKAETIRQIEEIRREELALKEDAVPAPKPLPAAHAEPAAPAVPPEEVPAAEVEIKTFKSISRSSEIKLEKMPAAGESADEAGITSRKLKSLGQTQAPAYVYGAPEEKPEAAPAPAPAAAPAAAAPGTMEPLPQQAGGLVYDFTVVTARPESSQQFRIETRQEAAQPQPVKPPTYDFGVQPAAAPQPAPVPQAAPAFQTVQSAPQPAPAFQPAPQQAVQHGFQFQPSAAPAAAPSFQQPASMAPAEAAPADSPEKTQRIPVAPVKVKPETKAPERKRRGGKTAFLVMMFIFFCIAAGGLGFFFMGEGGSLSEFSMLNMSTRKKASAMTSQLEPKEGETAAKAGREEQPAAQPAAQAAAPASQPEPQAEPQPAAQTAAAQPTGENIKKAIDIVKEYKLSGGRGNIATWFANSFMPGSSSGSREEWTATPLHGDILVVQYRLLRAKQDPVIYQFEVDAAKQDIVRGINNNAIELLDSSSARSASAAPAKKPAAKAKRVVKAAPREVPILPLPDAPAAQRSESEPTGFENPSAEGSDQVKYLKAQESDEELF